nr:fanconi associated nuclease 1 [Hymenolepis microstoma]
MCVIDKQQLLIGGWLDGLRAHDRTYALCKVARPHLRGCPSAHEIPLFRDDSDVCSAHPLVAQMEDSLVGGTTESGNLMLHSASTIDESSLVSENSNLPDEIRQPYYLDAFLFIIKNIFQDSFYDKLFDRVDQKSKLVYLTLFRRSRKLYRSKTIRLLDQFSITDLDGAYKELINGGFFSSDLSSFTDEELLNLLDKSELIRIASSFKLRIKGAPKKAIIESLLKSAKCPSLLSFFTSSKTTSKSQLRKLVESFLGPCFFIEKSPSLVILRILFCFSLTSEKLGTYNHPISFEAFLSKELYSFSQVRNNDITYPDYKILRKSEIFRTRDELFRVFEFAELRHRLDNLILLSEFLDAYNLFMEHLESIKIVIQTTELDRDDLPKFLRSYTLPNVAFGIVRLAINVFERLRKFSEAVELIQLVLSSNLIHSISSKSVCFLVKRLLLDQGNHCRDKIGCLKQIADLFPVLKELHCGHRLDIQRQLGTLTGIKLDNDRLHLHRESTDESQQPQSKRRKIVDTTNVSLINKIENLMKELLATLKSAPVVKVSAPISVSSVEIGVSRPLYLWQEIDSCSSENAEPITSILHVEEWALKHYMTNVGFEKGVHCESSIYTTLCGLLFYDLIYGVSRPDAFYSLRQSGPLDLFTGEFYSNQKDIIESRLEMINSAERNSSESKVDPVSQLLLETWRKHNGEHCVGINWELFNETGADVVNLFWCLGPKVVASFCRLLISNYSNWCSGLPDLCVWSPSKAKSKLIEVKGPGDKLSSQQVVWIDQLLSFGADVEICSIAIVPRSRYEHIMKYLL